jgi:SNF2 family DNA or RNA helicase
MQDILLKVPFDKKDDFKAQCQEKNIPYFWDKEQRSWGIKADKLPSFLEKYKSEGEQYFVIDCDYTYYPFASKAGAKWDGKKRVAVYKGSKLPTELTGFEPKPFSLQEKVQRELNKSPIRLRKPTRDIKPHPHQKTAEGAINRAFNDSFPGFLLADETGLGKTISTWLGVKKIASKNENITKVLIVGPLNAIETWRETIVWLGNESKNKNNFPIEVSLINYEKLRNLFSEDASKVRSKTLKGIARFAEAESYDIIIFDESHYLKTPTSARTKLARKLESAAKFTIWISATAGQNPLELSYLSNLLSFQTDKRPKLIEKNYEEWCQEVGIGVQKGKFGRWTWEGSEKDNQTLHKILFGKVKSSVGALRRRCSDIEGWPELQRIPKRHELSAVEHQSYEMEWKEFLKAVEEDKLNRIKGSKDTSKGIAQLGRLRQKASILRVNHTADLAEELLSNGYQVAISVEYLKTLDLIKEALIKKNFKVVEFSGRNTSTREEERLKYQEGAADVIIFSTESSISLHQLNDHDKPRAQINHDLRWSAIEQEQIDGRSHRNGRHAPVYWSFSSETIEERVATILLSKLEAMNTLRGDRNVDFSRIYNEIIKDYVH